MVRDLSCHFPPTDSSRRLFHQLADALSSPPLLAVPEGFIKAAPGWFLRSLRLPVLGTNLDRFHI